jgi:hypothetical protein
MPDLTEPETIQDMPGDVTPASNVAVGHTLVCDNFEDGGRAEAIVRDINEEGAALLWIERLGREWPIRLSCVEGDHWTHEAADYPPPGEDAAFDAKYRPAVPTNITKPSRRGHVWARTVGCLAGIGFNELGERQTQWRHDELGEFHVRLLAEVPSSFRKV